jgi:hypothetical protein
MVFFACGIVVLTISHGAAQTIGFETEAGVLTNGTAKVNDNSASGGANIKFGNALVTSGLNLIASKSDLDAVKAQIVTGDKAAYWSYIVGSYATKINPEYTPDWSVNVTYNGSTFNPNKFYADDLDSTSVNSEGAFILASAQNSYGCALKWYYSTDQAWGLRP